MSNPGQQGSGGPQLLKPDDIFKLQCLNDDHKAKYKSALSGLWGMMQSKPQDSNEYQTARAKLLDWSQRLLTQEKAHRQRQAANRPQSQQGQPAQQPQAAAQQQRPPSQNAPNPPANAQGQGQPQMNPQIVKHVQDFQYQLPPGGPQPATPEGEAKIKELRQSYALALTKQERASNRVKQINGLIENAKKAGQEPDQNLLAQRAQSEREYHAAKKFVEDFRSQQTAWRAQTADQQRTQQPQPQQQPQQNFPQVKTEPQIKIEGGAQQQNIQQMNMGNAQIGPQGQRPSLGSQQQPVNTSLPAQQPGQTPMNFNQQGQVNQAGQQQPRPQINPQQQNMNQPQQNNNSPHPQSATSANPSGPPVPLSHQAAVSAAQRSYSNSQPEPQRTMTPQQMPAGGNYHNIGNRDQMNNPKMPIPKTLNVQTPQPVAMGPARPTMGGPTNGTPGMMGQPVINKFPTFQLEGEGDRILSKRKLDELVRQVTGGGEGPGGESLTPEVEEAMLQLADEFVDNVITSSCKLSKLRETPQLDLRDIQLVLERNYNIRIPGYASDEIRTVRKLHPAPGWTQKMNAVQAAKVMGDDVAKAMARMRAERLKRKRRKSGAEGDDASKRQRMESEE